MKRIFQHLSPGLVRVMGTFLSKGAAAGVQFIQSIILSRSLGAEALGLYYFALSIYRVAECGAPLGLQTSTVREVAAARAQGAWGSIRQLAWRSALLCGALGLAASVTAFAFAGQIAQALEGHEGAETALHWMASAMIPGCIVLSLTSSLRGLGLQTLANIFGSLILPLVATLLFLLVFQSQGYLGAVQAFILGQMAALALLAIALIKLLRHRPHKTVPSHSLFHSALPFWVVSVASLANDSLGILLLGFLGASADVGIFGVAVRLAMPLSFLGASVQAVCDSRFAGLHRLGNTQGLRQEYWASLRTSALLAVSMGLGLGLLAHPLLSLFGPEFARAETAFRIILIGICLVAALGPAGSFLSMTGRADITAWTAVLAFPLAAGLMLHLIPQFGATGAAMATSLTLSLRVLVQFLAAQRVFNAMTVPAH
ncbi:MAG: hypothetical protein RL764_1643 [Pseudomonadota bacterium]